MDLWNALMEAGAPKGLLPTGLGCRDSLRLEMGYALYGNDLDENHTPLESGLGWITKLEKGDFIGRDVLLRQKDEGVQVRLVGLHLQERGFPRHGYPITSLDEEVGVVTSGVVSPSLGVGVAMGYVPAALAKAGTELGVKIRDKVVPAQVQRPPFYKEGSVRR
jgi:aminomethyltransferase